MRDLHAPASAAVELTSIEQAVLRRVVQELHAMHPRHPRGSTRNARGQRTATAPS